MFDGTMNRRGLKVLLVVLARSVAMLVQ
eukprot:jgi/Hompol1/1057/HPOL_005495-RA